MDPSSLFELMDSVANFLRERFFWHLAGKPSRPGPNPPLGLNVRLVTDIELLATQACAAYNNRGRLVDSFSLY